MIRKISSKLFKIMLEKRKNKRAAAKGLFLTTTSVKEFEEIARDLVARQKRIIGNLGTMFDMKIEGIGAVLQELEAMKVQEERQTRLLGQLTPITETIFQRGSQNRNALSELLGKLQGLMNAMDRLKSESEDLKSKLKKHAGTNEWMQSSAGKLVALLRSERRKISSIRAKITAVEKSSEKEGEAVRGQIIQLQQRPSKVA
ncbi:hypothetical protein GOV09_05850 [Candidatus Woesearchaeota archaeon]|nr:hypothetical protein [Candidatus Woesearchaeota archaeon]